MAMSTTRALTGPPSDLFNPPFRTITFTSFPAVVLVSTHLRHAWTALPPTPSPTDDDVMAFIKANHALTPQQRLEQVPQNPDKDSIDTPWRERVLERWMSVFVDVSAFLQEVGPGVGHLRTWGKQGVEYSAEKGSV
ncbi:hypothetical protein ACLMJK_003745 [Lecanora helva]